MPTPAVSSDPQLRAARACDGFTLVELLFVVAIIGILLAVAMPAYETSQLRAGRAEAKSTLLQVAANQERFYSAGNTYSTNANPVSSPVQATVTTETGKFVVSVAACATGTIANCFVATATPQGSQANDDCGNFTLSSTGVRGTSTGDSDECWER